MLATALIINLKYFHLSYNFKALVCCCLLLIETLFPLSLCLCPYYSLSSGSLLCDWWWRNSYHRMHWGWTENTLSLSHKAFPYQLLCNHPRKFLSVYRKNANIFQTYHVQYMSTFVYCVLWSCIVAHLNQKQCVASGYRPWQSVYLLCSGNLMHW